MLQSDLVGVERRNQRAVEFKIFGRRLGGGRTDGRKEGEKGMHSSSRESSEQQAGKNKRNNEWNDFVNCDLRFTIFNFLKF